VEYENPKVAEGINVSKTHPLTDFTGLVAGVAFMVLTVMGVIYLLASWLLPYVPFSIEQTILANYNGDTFFSTDLTDEEQRVQRYLQALANDLIADTDFPEEITLTIHYLDSDQKNAYATLGGNILIHRGLLQAVESENGLAMVLGHEIGHIVHRDPIMTLGRGAIAVGAIALLSGFSQTNVANKIFSISTESLLYSFSRDQERLADAYSLQLLANHYGHQHGADEFFNHIQDVDGNIFADSSLAEFFSTHPNLKERIERIDKVMGDEHGNWKVEPLQPQDLDSDGHRQPLPFPRMKMHPASKSNNDTP
jgi:Zn-dependent protease with chaperone function